MVLSFLSQPWALLALKLQLKLESGAGRRRVSRRPSGRGGKAARRSAPEPPRTGLHVGLTSQPVILWLWRRAPRPLAIARWRRDIGGHPDERAPVPGRGGPGVEAQQLPCAKMVTGPSPPLSIFSMRREIPLRTTRRVGRAGVLPETFSPFETLKPEISDTCADGGRRGVKMWLSLERRARSL